MPMPPLYFIPRFRATHRLGTLMLVIWGLSGATILLGQDMQPALPRVGDSIERDEILYFRLFPDFDDASSATVRREGAELTIDAHIGDESRRITLTACETEVFGRILLAYELLASSDHPLDALALELKEPTLLRCFASFMQKRVMTISAFPAKGGMPQRVLLHDGAEVKGVPLALTDTHLAMWTGGNAFDVRYIDTLLEIIPLRHIDSIHGSYYTKSAGHGWLTGLVGGCAALWAIAEGQREPRLGSGGSGTTVLPLPLAAVLAAGVGYFSGLLGASVAGDLRDALALHGEHGDMAMEKLQGWTETLEAPPEVWRLLSSRNEQDSDGTSTPDGVGSEIPAGRTRVEQHWMTSAPLPDVEIGIHFLLHVYDATPRPFSVLPGIWVGKAFPLLEDEQGRTRLLLFPRLAYGFQHASAGMGVIFRTEETVELSAGLDYLWNRETLGTHKYQGTGYGVHIRTAWLVTGDWKRSTFASVGVRFALAGARVLLEARVPLAASVAERRAYVVLGEETEVYVTPLRNYFALGISTSWPISF